MIEKILDIIKTKLESATCDFVELVNDGKYNTEKEKKDLNKIIGECLAYTDLIIIIEQLQREAKNDNNS